MKVAFLADVHANLPAFEAALGRAKRWGAEEVMLLGDLVGYGPHPEDVVSLARKRGLAGVAGNHDRAVAGKEGAPAAWKAANPAEAARFEASVAWTLGELQKSSVRWLAGLPPTRRLRLGRYQVLLAHGSPESAWEALGPALPDAALAERVERSRCDLLVAGHTHVAEVRPLPGGRLYVNAGSVGRPADGPEAALVLADFEAESFLVERVAFDVDAWRKDLARAEAEWLPRSHEPT